MGLGLQIQKPEEEEEEEEQQEQQQQQHQQQQQQQQQQQPQPQHAPQLLILHTFLNVDSLVAYDYWTTNHLRFQKIVSDPPRVGH